MADSVEGVRARPFPVALLIAALASSLVFAAIALEVSKGRPVPADAAVLSELRRGKNWSPLRTLVSALGVLGGAAGVIAVAALTVSTLLLGRRPHAAIFFVGSVAVSALNPLLKEAFGREPPAVDHPMPGETGFFPSGHATGSMALAAAILVLVWDTRFRVLATAVAAALLTAVGLSALYDGGHWPSDVIGGWALSLAWVAGLRCVIARAERRRRRPLDQT